MGFGDGLNWMTSFILLPIETSHFIKLIERIFSFEIIDFFNDSIIDSYTIVSLILYQGPIFIKITTSLNS